MMHEKSFIKRNRFRSGKEMARLMVLCVNQIILDTNRDGKRWKDTYTDHMPKVKQFFIFGGWYYT